MKLITDRLRTFSPNSHLEEQHALKQIIQEITLFALSEAGFFEVANFHGGTALRILHELPRFSEDLDFALHNANPNFSWETYREKILSSFDKFGIKVEIKDKQTLPNNAVKKMVLKNDSFLEFYEFQPTTTKASKLLVKIEVDAAPPEGAQVEGSFLFYPQPFRLSSHNLESCFAGKLHALLCRQFIKGRDWFDFLWYVGKKVQPNLVFLQNALHQSGPWAKNNSALSFNHNEIAKLLAEKINSISINDLKKDTLPFVSGAAQASVEMWSLELFLAAIGKFESIKS